METDNISRCADPDLSNSKGGPQLAILRKRDQQRLSRMGDQGHAPSCRLDPVALPGRPDPIPRGCRGRNRLILAGFGGPTRAPGQRQHLPAPAGCCTIPPRLIIRDMLGHDILLSPAPKAASSCPPAAAISHNGPPGILHRNAADAAQVELFLTVSSRSACSSPRLALGMH